MKIANFSDLSFPFFIPAGPPRTLVSLPVTPGSQYTVEAVATVGIERAKTEINVTIPTGQNFCSSHPRNRNVVVNNECRHAVVEFAGINTETLRCHHLGHQDEPQSCGLIAEIDWMNSLIGESGLYILFCVCV